MRLNTCLCLIVVSLIFGCDESEQREVNELDDVRFMGLAIEPESISLADPPEKLNVRAFVHDRGEALTYRWRLCPSLGSLTRFECLAELDPFSGQSETPVYEFPLAPSLFDISAAEQGLNIKDWQAPLCPEQTQVECSAVLPCPAGSECVEQQCVAYTELLPIVLALKVETTDSLGHTLTAARELPIFVGESSNQAIALDAVLVEGADERSPALDEGCAQTFEVDQADTKLALTAQISPDSLDEFLVEDDGMCTTRRELDIGFVSWFTTSGKLKRVLSDLTEPTNVLTLDPGELVTRVYAIARDGRGTLDMKCVEFFQPFAQQEP